jgi:hypothetical protein
MRELEGRAVQCNDGPISLQLPQAAHTLYEQHANIRLAPVDIDATNIGDDEHEEDEQDAPALPANDAEEPVAGALRAPAPPQPIDRIEQRTPLAQVNFFKGILGDVANGDRPAYKDWKQLTVRSGPSSLSLPMLLALVLTPTHTTWQVSPTDALCSPCDDSTAFQLKPIKFWSDAKWGLDTPCVNEGYEHAGFVKRGRWAMRRVKCVFDDFYLAGRRTSCFECKKKKVELKAELAELQEALSQEVGEEAAAEGIQDGDEDDEESFNLKVQIVELERAIKEFHYTSSTINAHVNKFVFEKYPGIGAAFPAILTHKTAISMEALMVIGRAARTAQQSHDLEAMFHEFRSLGNARARLSFYQLQWLAGEHIPRVGVRGLGLVPDPIVSNLSNLPSDRHLSNLSNPPLLLR